MNLKKLNCVLYVNASMCCGVSLQHSHHCREPAQHKIIIIIEFKKRTQIRDRGKWLRFYYYHYYRYLFLPRAKCCRTGSNNRQLQKG